MGRPRGRKPRAGGKAAAGTFDPAIETVERGAAAEARRFVALLIEAVPYSMFVDHPALNGEPLSIPRFSRLRNLAILERFFGMGEAEIAEKLGSTLDHVQQVRSDPLSSVVSDAVRDAGSQLAKARTIDEWAEFAEHLIGGELLLSALHEPSPRERLKAAEALADRRSAKKTRNQDEKKGLFFPPELLEKMRFAMTLGEGSLTLTAEPLNSIDASTLNVPRLPGKGEAGK
jgi:hypothetical protein